MIEKNIFIWEGRTCFLSTEHSDDDIQRFISTTQTIVDQLVENGYVQTHEDVQEHHPITPEQKRFYDLATSNSAGNKACNIVLPVEISGKLHAQALQNSINVVLNQNDGLRASFHQEERQIFQKSVFTQLLIYDVQNQREEQQETFIAQIFEREKNTEFELTKPPLARFWLIRKSENCFVFGVTIHHLICDGWALALLFKQIGQAYSSRVEGKAGEAQQPMQFSEFLKIRLKEMHTQKILRLEKYWIDQLDHQLMVNEESKSYKLEDVSIAKHQSHVIHASLIKGVETYGRKHNASLFMVLFAAFNLVVHHFKKLNNLTVGIPLISRSIENSETAIGNCVNVIPLSTRVNERESFADYLKQAKIRLIDSYEHMEYPYVALKERFAKQSGSMSDNLFNIVFNMEPKMAPVDFHSLTVKTLDMPGFFPEFPMMVNLMDVEIGMCMNIDYNTEFCQQEILNEWIAKYELLLYVLPIVPHEVSISEILHYNNIDELKSLA